MTTTKSVAKKKTVINPAKKNIQIIAPEYYFNVDLDRYSERYGLTIYLRDNADIAFSLEIEESSISCGVMQVHELPENYALDSLWKTFSSEKAKQILAEALILYFNTIKANIEDSLENQSTFLLLSNNNSTESSRINSVLDDICAYTEWRKNPNSGNKIKIWIY